MSKTKISEYSATANSNTDVASINIDEGCAPSGINNAIRAVMGHLKDFQQGTNSDPFNGPVNGTVGATTPAAGTFTTIIGTDTTDASSTTAAAVKTAGGLAVAKKLYVGTGGAVVDGVTVGKGAGSVATNTAVGASALAANTVGVRTTAIGYQALTSSDENDNTGVGERAGYSNTTGYNNAFFGARAAYLNTTGSQNTALGRQALYSNTTASNNTAVGYQSLYANTTGQENTVVGFAAADANTTGREHVAMGNNALGANTTGSYSVAIGKDALSSNTTSSHNTALGYQALYSNTTLGYSTAVGSKALYTATGEQNTAFGYGAGFSVTTGTLNLCVGTGAGYYLTTGSKNTILGAYSGNQGGLDIRTASNYIVLSDGDGNPRAGYTPAFGGFFINREASGTYAQFSFLIDNAQKAAMWWDNSNLRLQTYTGTTNGPYISQNGTSWTNSSDERLKNITGEIQNGLAKVCTLRAAEYTLKADESAKPQIGLIAQDVLAVLPEAVDIPVDGVTEKDGSPSMMGVQYTNVIPLLVAAIKELKAEIDILKGQA